MGQMVEIPRVGTMYYVPELNRINGYEKDSKDISWEILSTETYQDNDGTIRTICVMHALNSADAEELGIDPERINLDLYDHISV